MGRYTVDLPCISDTYTDINNPTTSYGAASVLLTGSFHPGDSGYNQMEHISLLKFNFSSIPINKTITSAYLRVYSINGLKVDQIIDYNPLMIQPLTNSFSESDTFNSLKLNIPEWGYPGARADLNLATPANAYMEIELLTLLNSDFKNNGIAIAWIEDRRAIDYKRGAIWQIGARNSANPPMIRVTYEDTIPEKPTALAPIGLYVKNTDIIQFKWQYNNSTGGIQNKFDLKWSINGTAWTTVSQATANNYYNMPANTLPTGNIYWKVVTYNNLNEASPESAVNTFYAIGAPPTPVITNITNVNTPRPTITWTSNSQQVYQVQILQGSNIIFDTGDVPGVSIRSHTVSTFLDDGTYIAKVRVKNEYDLYSNWASANFSILTPKPVKPPITLNQNKYSLDVTSNLADNSYLLLFRKMGTDSFKCVAKSTTSVIKDFTVESNKQYQYFVRAVSSTGTYLDSDIKTITSAKINRSVLSPVTDLSNIFEVKYNLNERPIKNITISTPNTTNYFSGRKYPVVEYSEHLTCGITLSFFVQDESEYQQLLNILYLKGIVLYRDGRRKFYGNISGINSTDHFAGYVVNLSINQTDYNEFLEV